MTNCIIKSNTNWKIFLQNTFTLSLSLATGRFPLLAVQTYTPASFSSTFFFSNMLFIALLVYSSRICFLFLFLSALFPSLVQVILGVGNPSASHDSFKASCLVKFSFGGKSLTISGATVKNENKKKD